MPIAGSRRRLQGWLTFGLTPEQEDRYRTASLARDLAQARVAIGLMLVAAVAFAAADYAFLGPSWPFYELSALRLAFVCGGLLLFGYTRTVTGYRSHDRAVLAWGVSFVVLLEIAHAVRAHTYVAHAMVAVVGVLLTLLVIPSRFVSQLAVALGIVAAEAVLIGRMRASVPASLTVLTGMLGTVVVAGIGGWQLHASRRRAFLNREGERHSRAAADRSLAETQRAEGALRTTLESIADGFFACDEEWRFVYVNAAAERILGIPRGDVLGQILWDVFPPTLGTKLEREYRRAAAGEVRDFENFYEPWTRWFHNRCSPREGGGLTVYFEDITERKRAEEEVRRGRQLSEALNRINQALHSTLDISEITQRLVAEGALALGSDGAAISLREGDGWKVTSVHGIPPHLVGERTSDDEERHAVLAVESRQPVAVADAFGDERFNREHLRRHGVRSVLVAPLVVRDQPLGVISFNYHRDRHAFTEAEVAFAGQLAATAAVAFENARLLDQRAEAVRALDQSRRDLDRAQEVGQIGWWRLDTQRNVLTWSDENHRIFGVARGTPLTYESFLAVVHPADRPYVDAKWRAGLRGEPYDIEHRLLIDGRVKWVREKAYLEFDDAGGLKGGFGITQDVTERKRAEEGLQQAKEELERRVRERTAELAASVESLREEVARRGEAEQALRERSNQLRRLATELTLAEQREQRRLAELLHDNLQQLLAAAKFRTAMLAATAEQEEVRQTAGLVEVLLNQSIEWSHSLTGELSPTVLHRSGLVPALEWLVAWMKDKHGLTVALDVETGASLASEDVALLVFRSVRELLFNTVKHAGVKAAALRVRHRDGNVEIEVSDEGTGFVPAAVEGVSRDGGFGLFNVRERIGLLGGQMDIDSAPGRGTRILLRVPSTAGTALAP
jgi:PAS domain S-box-containing protein